MTTDEKNSLPDPAFPSPKDRPKRWWASIEGGLRSASLVGMFFLVLATAGFLGVLVFRTPHDLGTFTVKVDQPNLATPVEAPAINDQSIAKLEKLIEKKLEAYNFSPTEPAWIGNRLAEFQAQPKRLSDPIGELKKHPIESPKTTNVPPNTHVVFLALQSTKLNQKTLRKGYQEFFEQSDQDWPTWTFLLRTEQINEAFSKSPTQKDDVLNTLDALPDEPRATENLKVNGGSLIADIEKLFKNKQATNRHLILIASTDCDPPDPKINKWKDSGIQFSVVLLGNSLSKEHNKQWMAQTPAGPILLPWENPQLAISDPQAKRFSQVLSPLVFSQETSP